MTISVVTIQPLVALIAGILILVVPRLLNYIVAIYLILVGVLGLWPDLLTRVRRLSLADLDHQPAAHLAGDDVAGGVRGWRRSRSSWSSPRACRGRGRARAASRPRCAAPSARRTELMPSSDTPRRMNGATEVGSSMPAALPQAATAPPLRGHRQDVGEHRAADRVDARRPAFLGERLRRAGELRAVDDRGGAEALQVVVLVRRGRSTASTV